MGEHLLKICYYVKQSYSVYMQIIVSTESSELKEQALIASTVRICFKKNADHQ